MCLIAEIAMLIFGIIALATGKIKLSRNVVVRGPMARVIGLVLMAPIPLSLAVGLAIGTAFVIKGKTVTEVPWGIRLIEPVIALICGVVALVMGRAFKSPPAPKRRRPDEFDDGEEDPLALPRKHDDGRPTPGRETAIQDRPPDVPPRRPANPEHEEP
jgi:hypothetical protein